MQFETNADYPPNHRDRIRDPDKFPGPIIDQCESHTDRVLARGQIRLMKNIIIPIINISSGTGIGDGHGMDPRSASAGGDGGDFDDDSMYSADSYSDNDDEMIQVDNDTDTDGNNNNSNQPQMADRAYWLCREIREAIYGHVWAANVLKRSTHIDPNTGQQVPIWEMTEERCAVKVMSHHAIMEQRGAAEDPYKEVSAMQYLQKYHMASVEQQARAERANNNGNGNGNGNGNVDILDREELRKRANETMFDTHVMMPMDILTDNRNLYCVMPFCDGGELFDMLERRQKFPEDEARYWFKQVLNGVETLQKAGICHRDMSLENLLTDSSGKALVIDFGMCLKVPFLEEEEEEEKQNTENEVYVSSQLQSQLQLDGREDSGVGSAASSSGLVDYRTRQRCLIRPLVACGKPYYISPEVFISRQPFDGYAIDMWALGPLLFLMVCGFPPWEEANMADQRFYFFSGGHFRQTVQSWNLGLSEDLMDLLQRMFWRDPTQRLSLAQVRAHPWMDGPVMPPPRMG